LRAREGQPTTECRVAAAEGIEHRRSLDRLIIRDREDRIALQLRQPERGRDGANDGVEEVRHHGVRGGWFRSVHDERVMSVGHGLEKAGISGDVGKEQDTLSTRCLCHGHGHRRP
jgi:hypothetical protein